MAAQPSSILLKGGTLLLHDDADHVIPTRADLLIEGNTIAKISPDIPASSAAKVVDCASKIISPGFVSTHAHLWQTQLKGRHSEHTLVEYMPAGCYSGSFYTVPDLFWGQLAGALEALDGGTTTVVDHAHLNLSPAYPRAAVQALATSGLRAVYCYTPRRQATSFDPLVLDEDSPADPAVLDEWERLAAAAAVGRGFGGGRVTMGFAMDNLFLPTDKLQEVYGRLRKGPHAARVITTHAPGGLAHGGRPYAVGILDGAGLLGPDVLLSHAPGLVEEDVARLRATGARVSSTPNTEMQMGMEPVAMWRSMLEGDGVGSLGVDCHTWGTSYLPTQMTLVLQQRRLLRAQEVGRGEGGGGGGRWVRRVEGTVEEAFNLGTIAGARAAGLAGEVGRLREGFRADVVVLDGKSPGMLAAALQDPVAAVVLHSSVRDVDVVIVDGVMRKEGGQLCDVRVEEALGDLGEEEEEEKSAAEVGRTLSWEDVARETLRSREVVDGKIGGMDFGPAVEAVIDAWHMNRSNMVER